MAFIKNDNIEKSLKDSIWNDLILRDSKICDAWNRESSLSIAVGVKEELDVEELDTVKGYIENIGENEIALDSGAVVKLLKGDVKERKGKAVLIYRYQLLEGF